MFAVIFEDNEGCGDMRTQYMAAHLSFLDANADVILGAGPLVATDGTISSGMWIVSCEEQERVSDLVKADPFWPTGLRKSVTIRKWRRVFAGGRRL